MNITHRPLVCSSFLLAALGIIWEPQSSLAQSSAADDSFKPPEISTWATSVYYSSVPALAGATVEVWHRAGLGYIFKPYVAVDWQAVGADIEEECSTSDRATITVNVQFDANIVRQQAVQAIRSNHTEDLNNLTAVNLRAFPFASLRVVTGAQASDGLSTKERLRLPDVEEISIANYTTGLNTSVLGTRPIHIEDSCEALRKIHLRKSLQAHAFITYDTSKISSAYISLNQVSKTNAFVDLLYDEKETGEKKILRSSSSGGWGINMTGFSIGKSSSSSSIQPIDTRERFVTDRTLSHAIAKAASQISVKTLATDGETPMSHSEVLVLVNNFVMGNATPIRADFEGDSDSGWQLATQYGTHPLRKEDIDELIQAKTDLELNAQTEHEGSFKMADYFEVEGKDKREQLQHLIDDLKWEKKGTEYIPISVTLFQVRGEDLSIQASMNWENIVSETANGLMFVDLSVVDLERADFRQGFFEGQKAAQAPPKLLIQMPENLWINHVPGAPMQPPLNHTYSCTDPKTAHSTSLTMLNAGSAPNYDEYLSAVGCELATPANGPACASDSNCEFFTRTPFCLTSQAWLWWFTRMQQVHGIADNFWNFCSAGMPPAPPIPGTLPGPSPMGTAPYPGSSPPP